jgi:hypothetical protein
VGRLGRCELRLAPFKFRVRHTRGVDNILADAFSRMFEVPGRNSRNNLSQSIGFNATCVYVIKGTPEGRTGFIEIFACVHEKEPRAAKFQVCKIWCVIFLKVSGGDGWWSHQF